MTGFKKIMLVFIVITVINFLLFLLFSLIIGGTATNGKIVGGQYYVGDHGAYREVPRLVYEYSLYHFYAVIVSVLFLGFPSVNYLFHVISRENSGENKIQ